MSITIGGIDPARAIVELEMRVLVLEQIIDRLVPMAQFGLGTKPLTQADLAEFRDNAVKTLQKKYPGLGITKKS